MAGVTLLIDGDPLVYACGFVAERRKHALSWVDVTPAGDRLRNASFDGAWRRDQFIEMANLHPDEYTSTPYSIPLPFGYATEAMYSMLDGIQNHVNAYLEAIGLVPAGRRIYLTGADNFRIAAATIRPYKGNRTQPRPYWYAALREWMVTRLGAIVVNGYEADDALAMIQWRHLNDVTPRTIICTIDKDLLMVPGLHYNTKRKESFQQSAEGATLSFYRQLMTGDLTDNIPGCHRIGYETARKRLGLGATEREMFDIVLATYAANMEKYPEHHAPHTDPMGSLIENAQLLHMLRSRTDKWSPPA